MVQDSEIKHQLHEIQHLEQQLQGQLMQKQTLQLEMNEVQNALSEVNKTSGDIYKILSGVMLKAEKKEVIKELEEKKKMLELKISAFSRQEDEIESRIAELKKYFILAPGKAK